MTPPRPKSDDVIVFDSMLLSIGRELGAVMKKPLTEGMLVDLAEELRADDVDLSARRLKRKWGLKDDTYLIPILGSYGEKMYFHLEKLVKQWVVDNKVTLTLPIGTRANSPKGPGTIVDRDEERATYVVRPDTETSTVFRGIYVEAENIEPLEPRPAAQ